MGLRPRAQAPSPGFAAYIHNITYTTMRTTLLTLAVATFTLTIYSCASTSRIQDMQQEIDRCHRIDSLAYDIIIRNGIPDTDGGDAMSEYLELHQTK